MRYRFDITVELEADEVSGAKSQMERALAHFVLNRKIPDGMEITVTAVTREGAEIPTPPEVVQVVRSIEAAHDGLKERR